jgi:hypothetical protein
MKIKSKEETKTTHHIIVSNGYTIHRREKQEYDFKEKAWVRKSLTWNIDHRGVDSNWLYDKKAVPSSKQLEREFQLRSLLEE